MRFATRRFDLAPYYERARWRRESLQPTLILKVVLQRIVDKFCQLMIVTRQLQALSP
ncbi:hypothetical protein ACVIIZ_005181 [Bradyrhizobium sp. USDA 4523]|uniref:hypothetical protein n=1 Tax=unclassified Bradyrhizobium TaxID=2631580 RepID=UPI0020A07399|nr:MULTISPECIES: hypothetical protein [unclassified Bradyrhizobium]MCP1838882.1 hypothetical protein [Bradyrhizobium sp. USDA 4538]MCP1899449.1 hypothetical protein [Bradyrhizobium sp. USDA 4537]MCP1986440.1 hypothetical protein [Bradyrhizobium sp. USDA 4539]